MKMQIVRHTVCLNLGYLIGPYLAALWIELLVAIGVRMDFTLWRDWLFRISAIILFELLWPRAIALADKWLSYIQPVK